MTANTPQSNAEAYIQRKAQELLVSLKDRFAKATQDNDSDREESRLSVTAVAQTCQAAMLGNAHLTNLFMALATQGKVTGSSINNADIQSMVSMVSMWAFKAALQFDAYQSQLGLMDYKGCTFLAPTSKEHAEKNGKIILD